MNPAMALDTFTLIDLGTEVLDWQPATADGQQRMAADLRLLRELHLETLANGAGGGADEAGGLRSPKPDAASTAQERDAVHDLKVFWVDELAGKAETLTATCADAAVAQVLAEHPSAQATAVSAEALEGCNRTRLLWEWMGMVTR
jgi:hypothetical protein